MSARVARVLLRLASLLVPSGRRGEWLEEWSAELEALAAMEAAGVAGIPGRVEFVVGAFPHAVWMRTEGWTMDSLMQDVRYAGRVLRRAPGFTAVAALTLALGIGANASIFSLVNGLVLRAPAGVVEPDRMVQIARSYEDDPRWDNFSWPALNLIGEEARALSGVAGFSQASFVLGRGVETERVVGHLVSGHFFDVVGVPPFLGRLVQSQDDIEPGGHPVVVLSHALWVGRYGSDPNVVGKTVSVGATPYTIVGVTPPGFTGVQAIGSPPSIFVPAMQRAGGAERGLYEAWGSSWIYAVGRLADGVSFTEAEASMAVVSSRLREADPINEGMVVLLAEGVGLDPVERAEANQISMILLLIAGLVLLITCTNVANLLLARASGRRTEVGVRMAIGAGRGRLVRQLVTESAVLALIATAVAVPGVYLAGDLLPAVFPYALSVSTGADARVYGFLLGTGLLAGLLFGTAPAWSASRKDVLSALRDGSLSGGRTRTRLRDVLVVTQLGLSLGLVAGAALLGRSVMNAQGAEPGFRPAGVTVGFIDLMSTGRYGPENGPELMRSALAAVGALPGVRSVTIANQAPITGGHARASVNPVGREDVSFEAEYVVVGPDYFETLGIPILRGRALRGFDDEPERVVVVNQRLADLFWPGDDAVGQQIERRGETWTVVGVAGDVQMRSLRAGANPGVYYPASQVYSSFVALHVASVDGSPVAPASIRAAVNGVDPELPVTGIVDLQSALTVSMGETRTIGYLVGVFAALALALAVVGLYGLVSYGASQRVRELGIRMALGAKPETLVQLILARGLGIAILGVGVGIAVAYGLGSVLRGLLFDVEHTDFLTLSSAALLLLGVSAIAAWVPARRASRVDAAVSLRDS